MTGTGILLAQQRQHDVDWLEQASDLSAASGILLAAAFCLPFWAGVAWAVWG